MSSYDDLKRLEHFLLKSGSEEEAVLIRKIAEAYVGPSLFGLGDCNTPAWVAQDFATAVAGMAEPWGLVADLKGFADNLYCGNLGGAALSLLSAIPALGLLFGTAKILIKGAPAEVAAVKFLSGMKVTKALDAAGMTDKALTGRKIVDGTEYVYDTAKVADHLGQTTWKSKSFVKAIQKEQAIFDAAIRSWKGSKASKIIQSAKVMTGNLNYRNPVQGTFAAFLRVVSRDLAHAVDQIEYTLMFDPTLSSVGDDDDSDKDSDKGFSDDLNCDNYPEGFITPDGKIHMCIGVDTGDADE